MEKGETSQEFKERSMRIFERIEKTYETGNVIFAICRSDENLYAVFSHLMGYSDLRDMDQHPSKVIGKADALAVITLIFKDNKEYHLLYTCEDRANGAKLEDDARKNFSKYSSILRKKMPAGMVI